MTLNRCKILTHAHCPIGIKVKFSLTLRPPNLRHSRDPTLIIFDAMTLNCCKILTRAHYPIGIKVKFSLTWRPPNRRRSRDPASHAAWRRFFANHKHLNKSSKIIIKNHKNLTDKQWNRAHLRESRDWESFFYRLFLSSCLAENTNNDGYIYK